MITRKIRNFLIYLADYPLYWLSRVFPKQDDVWVFGAWMGQTCSDNPRALFEYVVAQHQEIKAIWISQNPEVVQQLRRHGFQAYLRHSPRGIISQICARVSIFSHSNNADLSIISNTPSTLLVQLWHGAPIKKIGKLDVVYSKINPCLEWGLTKLFPYYREVYDLFIALSERDKAIYAQAYDAREVVVTGFPRNDILFTHESSRDAIVDQAVNDRFTVLYLPTFRGNVGSEFDLFAAYGFDPFVMDKLLRKIDGQFLIKAHPANHPRQNLINSLENYVSLHMLDPDVDVHQLLLAADVLITDYSSIYFDYLLTNRPIIFSPFDRETYLSHDREFYYSYDEVTPGPKCRDWLEVIHWIEQFYLKPDLYATERQKITEDFHAFRDNRSCERILAEIRRLI